MVFILEISVPSPNISATIIAFVLLVILDLIFNGSMQKLSGSISTNIGIQFQCNIDAIVALIVQGVTIISSPGSISNDPIIAINQMSKNLM